MHLPVNQPCLAHLCCATRLPSPCPFPPLDPLIFPQALSEEGYLYDATLIERWYPNSPTSPAEDQMLWPYTMDGGIPQVLALSCLLRGVVHVPVTAVAE